MSTKNEWQDAISKVIKEQDMYGRSFTRGYALYHIMKTGQYLTEEMADELEEQIKLFYDGLTETLEDYRIHPNLEAWAELLDLAVLAEIASYLEGEEDD